MLLNDVIYNYFADNFGHVESPPDKLLVEKYKNHTTKELKKTLKHLKSTISDLTEIKYVARVLRNYGAPDETKILFSKHKTCLKKSYL